MRLGVVGLAMAVVCVASPALAADCGRDEPDVAGRVAACERILAAPGVDDDTAAQARVILAQTYMAAEKLEAALAQADAAVKLAPKQPVALVTRGQILELLKRTDAALADYGSAIGIDPKNAPARVSRGLARYDRGEYEAALRDYDAAIAVTTDDASIYLARARAFYAVQDDESALDDLRKGERLGKLDLNQTYFKGQVLEGLERYPEALAAYNAALKASPDEPELLVRRADVLRAMALTEEASASYRSAQRAAPDLGEAYYGHAFMLMDAKDYDRATAILQTLLKRKPDDRGARQGLAAVAARQQRYDEAISILDGVVRSFPDAPTPYYDRGLLWHAKGDAVRAVADFDKAVSLDAKQWDARFARGRVQVGAKNYALAIKDFDALVEQNPDLAAIWWWRARAKSLGGDAPGAKIDRDKAMEISPDVVKELDATVAA
jgi:tetratricopeptide (TPR) repeat protein